MRLHDCRVQTKTRT